MNIREAYQAARSQYNATIDPHGLVNPDRRRLFQSVYGGVDNLRQQSQGTPTLEVHSPGDRVEVDQKAWQYIQYYDQKLNELRNGLEVSNKWEEDRLLAQQIVPEDHVITANMASSVFNENIQII